MARHGSWTERGHSRRLSVPSSANPFQPASVPSPGYAAGPMHPTGHSRTSSTSSIIASPTSSVHSFVRSEASEADWRRRTWHPSTYSTYYQQRPATSGLAFHQTPDALRPAFTHQQAAASPAQQRLPGFETFDQISQRPSTPPNQHHQHPTEPVRQPTYPGAERRGHASWDMSLHQNLTKLDIANGTPPREAGWRGHEAATGPPAQQVQAPPQPTRNGAHPTLASQASQETIRSPIKTHTFEVTTSNEPPSTTPRSAKRQGFYHAPASFNLPHAYRPAPRTASDDTSSSEGVPTPLTSTVDYQPSIIHANGYIEPQPAAASSFSVRCLPPRNPDPN
jgi:C2H2 transcription facotor